jgi:hypothetical protein
VVGRSKGESAQGREGVKEGERERQEVRERRERREGRGRKKTIKPL